MEDVAHAHDDGLVSVLMPVFNAERTLTDALDSVLVQTYRKLEVIVMDDGSTDSTSEIVMNAAESDPRILVEHTANRGVTVSLNSALSKARGQYIARMDADDICEPARFEVQVAHLRKHPNCVAVGSMTIEIDASGNVRNEAVQRDPRTWQMRDRCRGFRHFPPSPPTIPHPTAMMCTSALKAAGGYREFFRSSQDRDLWWRLSRLGEIHQLPRALLRYRVHDDSVSTRYPTRMVADALLADLSAVARHFGLEDEPILVNYATTLNAVAAIDDYSILLCSRYPARSLAAYRAITRGQPSLVGYPSRSKAIGEALSVLARFPFRVAGLRLLTAAIRMQPQGATS